jgi:hypothetical protein
VQVRTAAPPAGDDVKPKWIDEVKDIVQSDGFASWFDQLESARAKFDKVDKRYEELLTQVNLLEFRAELAHRKAIDTLERANVLEDRSAGLANQSATLENESFEAVSRFEMQRDRTTKLWEQLGGIDVKTDMAQSDGERGKLQKQRAKVSEDYEREDQRKQKLWQEVERLWVRSIDCNLALREIQQKAALVRAEAEKLFVKHEAEAQQASKLKAEAEQMAIERDRQDRLVSDALENARQQFECLLSEDFLYWVAREDNKVVYTVPLIEDSENYTIAVEPGVVYRCSPRSALMSSSASWMSRRRAMARRKPPTRRAMPAMLRQTPDPLTIGLLDRWVFVDLGTRSARPAGTRSATDPQARVPLRTRRHAFRCGPAGTRSATDPQARVPGPAGTRSATDRRHAFRLRARRHAFRYGPAGTRSATDPQARVPLRTRRHAFRYGPQARVPAAGCRSVPELTCRLACSADLRVRRAVT